MALEWKLIQTKKEEEGIRKELLPFAAGLVLGTVIGTATGIFITHLKNRSAAHEARGGTEKVAMKAAHHAGQIGETVKKTVASMSHKLHKGAKKAKAEVEEGLEDVVEEVAEAAEAITEEN